MKYSHFQRYTENNLSIELSLNSSDSYVLIYLYIENVTMAMLLLLSWYHVTKDGMSLEMHFGHGYY